MRIPAATLLALFGAAHAVAQEVSPSWYLGFGVGVAQFRNQKLNVASGEITIALPIDRQGRLRLGLAANGIAGDIAILGTEAYLEFRPIRVGPVDLVAFGGAGRVHALFYEGTSDNYVFAGGGLAYRLGAAVAAQLRAAYGDGSRGDGPRSVRVGVEIGIGRRG